jgi:hypothetical protein
MRVRFSLGPQKILKQKPTTRDNKMKPRYIHDCDKAKFLGCFEEYDLYFCDHWESKIMHTVVARYGNNPPDYMSGMFSIPFCEPLQVAYAKAVELGYANPDDYNVPVYAKQEKNNG